MPNWVANTVRITGPLEARRAFRERVRSEDSPLSFESLLPTPPRLLKSGRYSKTAAGKRLLAAFAGGDVAEQTRLLNDHPSLYFLAGKQGEREGEGWYYWRLEQWGTKGDAVDARVFSWRHTLNYEFLSAWSPPVAFVAASARRFRTLSFEIVYNEPGNCFAGWCRYERGRLTGQEDEGDVDGIIALLERQGCKDEAEMWHGVTGE